MKQAWHIFRKDIRYLRWEIGLALALSGLFVWVEKRAADPSWVELLLLGTFCYLVARLVHQEAIPGDRQFWITRPYQWKSLLAAKLLFALLFVNLPVLIGQWYLVGGRLPLTQIWPGLLWSQVLLTVALSFPVAALAALTRNFVSFVLTVVVLLALGFSLQQFIWLPFRITPGMQAWPEPILWVRHALAGLLLAAAVLAILYLQYKQRRTTASRGIAAATLAMVAAMYLYLPFSAGYAIESWMSKEPQSGAAISTAFAGFPQAVFAPHYQQRGRNDVLIRLPVAVRGVPEGMTLRPDAVQVTLRGPDGREWRSNLAGAKNRPGRPGENLLEVTVLVDPAFVRAEQEHPVHLHASLYLTLFGHTRNQSIDLRRGSTTVLDRLRCGPGAFGYVDCRAAFRWPALLLYTTSPGRELSS
ncbi:MAG TPA: hypothetical protein VG672_18700, partial [Bryobacteraceae bacterium]|nr:hypothetical protein [Bryobacteraceae bacterium]